MALIPDYALPAWILVSHWGIPLFRTCVLCLIQNETEWEWIHNPWKSFPLYREPKVMCEESHPFEASFWDRCWPSITINGPDRTCSEIEGSRPYRHVQPKPRPGNQAHGLPTRAQWLMDYMAEPHGPPLTRTRTIGPKLEQSVELRWADSQLPQLSELVVQLVELI